MVATVNLTLKQARLISEKKQKEIASLLGVHIRTYRKIEKNPEIATVKQTKSISNFLGISYNEIFFGS